MEHKQATPVDLSVLIDSGIDCFGYNLEGTEMYFGLLIDVDMDDVFPYQLNLESESMEYYAATIKPRMGYWFSNTNFSSAYKVVPRLKEAGFATEWNSFRECFRITGLQDGYCWPWDE